VHNIHSNQFQSLIATKKNAPDRNETLPAS